MACRFTATFALFCITFFGKWRSQYFSYAQISANVTSGQPIVTMMSSTVTPTISTQGQPVFTTLSPTVIANNRTITGLKIKVGMILPRNESAAGSFSNTASAVIIALERIFKEQLLPPATNISFLWRFDDCTESGSIGYAFELINEQKVDVLIAPPCIDGALVASHVGTYYNIPVIIWGNCFDSRFIQPGLFPSQMNVVTNYYDLSSVICAAMEYLSWDVFAVVYQISNNGICDAFQRDLERVANTKNSCLIGYKAAVDSWKDEDIKFMLAQIKANARIVVLCFDDTVQLRQFALKLADAGMDEAEYVYIVSRLKREWPVINGTVNSDIQNATLTANPWWLDTSVPPDNRDDDAYKIVKRSFRVQQDRRSEYIAQVPNFTAQIMAKMNEWPFYCMDCNHGQPASPYAGTLHDAMYAYALALSRTINQSGLTNIRNGRVVTKGGDLAFNGLSGTITLGDDGATNAKFILASFANLYGAMKSQIRFQITDGAVNISWGINASEVTIWESRNGVKPLSTPLCGFDGNGCPIDFFQQYKAYWIAAMVLGAFVVFGICLGIYYVIRLKQEETERQNRLWRIPFHTLVQPVKKNKKLESMHSLVSQTISTSTRYTYDSVKSITYGTIYIMTGGERIVGITHNGIGAQLDAKDMAELRAMRAMQHDNVNRFIGLSIDGPQVMSLWRYCSRGPLSDVIMGNTSLSLDGFFIYSLIRDVCEGLCFLHASVIGWHGNLRSTNCLVDDRWQVKLSEFGLKFFKAVEQKEPRDLIWTAPELLREKSYVGTKEGDIFSLAVTCAEVINMKPIWDASDAKGNAEEVIFLLKKGGRQPFRPRIEPATQDISPALTHLVKDCWNENPLERPKIGTVRSLLTSMNTAKSSNLMDHVFNLMEQYAGSLEEEIEERTKQLVEEKKKSDILLHRMLPKQVAEKLKIGQVVEPESFDCVTIFFSDVVSFTTLASKCTPLQVVNLLNNLYTLLDSIIGEYDVYKVETIGDGYLCVSGLPHRNGDEHARHAANMSLAIMRSLVHFTISHLPGEKLKLRIGLHTGPVVSGVVGLSMPRYCLFGDSVNTASRMESNSKPMMIHISASTNHFLTNSIGGFVTQSRGEVIIKGKGVMETFWLLGLEGDPKLREHMEDKEMGTLLRIDSMLMNNEDGNKQKDI
ncbi:adenylate and guanylate cyclase catalytic domain-containing protein [Ditylenchus destructor]|uniref:Guanylate cyclase n=1 Tax=Ditylenchus destructor TaxID=166010 RepID=A0AAD4MP89_9BILA|nr:adenylate and guanylate cyclase catalytic domain-containing protein [Ditylenchus destructor]